ncbi:MAG: ComEC/Rec2 family competence protein [Vulcanimicrobiaceae bacterium]
MFGITTRRNVRERLYAIMPGDRQLYCGILLFLSLPMAGKSMADTRTTMQLQTAHAEHVPIAYPRAGTVWRTDDGVTLTFIGPSLPLLTNTRNDINDNSVPFILQYKQFRMLFTGDAGAQAEQRFLAEGVGLGADVLKVGHHGSAYSSTPAFIAAVHARYAIISVGLHNMFGHPAPSTVKALEISGARVYRTDENGAVTVATDGGPPLITLMVAASPRR